MGTRSTIHFDTQHERLRDDIQRLAGDLGERNADHYPRLLTAATLTEEYLREAGYRPARQRYEAGGKKCCNVEAEAGGQDAPREILLVGARYDSPPGSPGAEDNASALAAMLALARTFVRRRLSRTLRFLAFGSREGSSVYARSCAHAGEKILGMISLDCLGCRNPAPGTQKLSLFGLLLPRQGDFVAFLANRESRDLLQRAIAPFRERAGVPAVGRVLPACLPVARHADHRSFWRHGLPALLVTDTGRLRCAAWHAAQDTPEKLDYEFLYEIVEGLKASLAALVQ